MDNPLEYEAKRRAKYLRGARITQLGTSAIGLLLYVEHAETRYAATMLAGIVGSYIAHLSAKRWQARADWYAKTADWKEKLQDLPDIRTFPKLDDRVTAISNDRKILNRIIVVLLIGLAIEVAIVIWKNVTG